MSRLTGQEVKFLEAAAEGLRNKQIAARFGVAEATVSNTLSSAYRKMGVTNRRDAAAEYRRNWSETGRKTSVAAPIVTASHRRVVEERWSVHGASLKLVTDWLYAAYLDLGSLRTPPRWFGSRLGPITAWALLWVLAFGVLATIFQIGATLVSLLYGRSLT